MKLSRLAATAAFISLSVTSTARASCWLPQERDAAQVRALQTMLMVGTLHCRSRDDYIAIAYNRFVRKHRALLDEQGSVLQRHFDRESTDDARAAYDRYNTALANEYAQQEFGSDDLCWSVASLAEQAEETDSRDLLSLASSYARPPSEATCRAAEASDPFIRPTLPVVRQAAPAPEPIEPVEAPVTHAAVAQPEPVATPAAQLAAELKAPEAPTQSREEALQLAIVALQAATAALQAAAAPEMPAVPAGEVSKVDLLDAETPGKK